MRSRWLVLVLAAACGPAQHPGSGSGGRCLSPNDLRTAVAHLEVPMTQQVTDKLTTYRLKQIYDDLVAAHQAAVTGVAPPALTSGSCLPERLLLHVIFTGDEKPIQALVTEPLYPTSPSPQNGLRDAGGHFPSTRVVELAALPNVQTVDEADPGEAE